MMCVIVDVNIAQRALLQEDDEAYGQLHKALFGVKAPRARLVYGGRLRDEYLVSGTLRRALLRLDQAGRARSVPDSSVNQEEQTVGQLPISSDDQHILALARIAGARILCSEDVALRADFKDKRFIAAPRGKIFSNGTHTRLLTQFCKEI